MFWSYSVKGLVCQLLVCRFVEGCLGVLCFGGIVAAAATVADDDGNCDAADTVIMALAIWILVYFPAFKCTDALVR